MTNEKARDFFSSYYEGSLEPGLAQSLELKLDADLRLKSEYRSFVNTMDDLFVLRSEEIQMPADLSEKISARLDREIWNKKQKQPISWINLLKGFAAASVVSLAVGAAVVSLRNAPSDTLTSSTISAGVDKATYRGTDEGLAYSYFAASPKIIVITSESGKEVERKEVGADGGGVYRGILRNPNDSAALFRIAVPGTAPTSITIPGKLRGANSGAGSVQEFSKAVANFYKTNVILEGQLDEKALAWKFSDSNIVEAVGKVLGTDYSVTLLKDNILRIEKN